MRILHLDTGKEMRGGQWQVLYLLRGLRERGHQTPLLARGALLESARQEGFEASEATPASVWGAARKYSLVHAHDSRSHTLAAVSPVRRLVVSRRVAFEPGAGLLSRWKYRRADLYLAVSNHVYQTLAASGVSPVRIRLVPDGVPPLEPAPPSGLIVAPLTSDPRKATAVLLETGLDIHYSSDLRRDLPGATAFIYLSEQEGLGSAVLLAMSAGVPVVASAVGGLPELIEHETTGLLTPNAPHSIRRAVLRLLEDAALGRRLADAARRRYLESFTETRMVEATERAYQELAA